MAQIVCKKCKKVIKIDPKVHTVYYCTCGEELSVRRGGRTGTIMGGAGLVSTEERADLARTYRAVTGKQVPMAPVESASPETQQALRAILEEDTESTDRPTLGQSETPATSRVEARMRPTRLSWDYSVPEIIPHKKRTFEGSWLTVAVAIALTAFVIGMIWVKL